MDIREITSDPRLHPLLQELDNNGNFQIEVHEVDADQDGYLDFTDVTKSWHFPKFQQLETALYWTGVTSLKRKNVGPTVIFIEQLHDRPEFNEEQKSVVGEYQFKILKVLAEKKPKHIFVESLYEDFPPDHPERNGPMAQVARLLFPERKIPEKPTIIQLDFLIAKGGAFVYAYLFDDVTLHRTINKDESDAIDQKVAAEGISTNACFILTQREEYATHEIMQFFNNNPDENNAVLIYGAAHIFRDDFEKQDNPPCLVSFNFLRILENFEQITSLVSG
jgi:hypothetical protein